MFSSSLWSNSEDTRFQDGKMQELNFQIDEKMYIIQHKDRFLLSVTFIIMKSSIHSSLLHNNK